MVSIVDTEWIALIREFEEFKGDGWVVLRELGRGNSAAVFLVNTPDGQVALKIYKPEFFEGQNAIAEKFRLSLQKGLQGHDCPSLVQIIEVGEVGDSAYVLMEYVPWPTLDQVVGTIKPENIPAVMGSVAKAAIWLDDRGLVHRDIKPANILVDPAFSQAKLVDLGVVRYADNSAGDLTDHGQKKPFIATAQYSSPEYLFRLVEPSQQLWVGLTIYQLGAVLHDLLNGKALFQEQVATENRYVLAMAVLRDFPVFAPVAYPPRWAALARRALTKDLAERLSMVTMQDFCRMHIVNLEKIRERLKLRSKRSGLAQLVEDESEQNRIYAQNIAEQIHQAFAHQLGAMGLERIRWVQSDRASAWAMTPIPAADGLELATRVAVTVAEGAVEVRLGQSLRRLTDLEECEAKDLLWRGTRDRFAAELASDILPQVEEKILLALDRVESLAEACSVEEMRLPMVLEFDS